MPLARREGCPRTVSHPAQTTALVRTLIPPAPASTSPQLATVQAQHEKLLQQVKKKTLAVAVSREAHRRAEQQYARSIEHLQRTIRDIRRALLGGFTYFLSPEHSLSKRDRGKLKRLKRELFDDDDTHSDEDDQGGGFSAEERGENWDDDLDDGSPRSANKGAPNRAGAPPPQVSSAVKPDEQASLIRTLFRRLTAVLHPDRVQDDAEHARRTSLMQELNAAYGRSDLAALLSLEKTWLPPGSSQPEETEKGCIARLKKTNTELRRQLRSLTAELKELRALSPELSQKPTKRRRAAAPAKDPLLAHLEEVLHQVQRLRSVAQAFRERRITTASFISAHYVGKSGQSDDDFSR